MSDAESVRWPARWRRVFAVEVPIVGATVAYWLVAPESFLAKTFGLEGLGAAGRVLLWSYASAVATMVFWLYLRVLLRPTVHWPTFRLFQEALLLGDVGVVMVWGYGLSAARLPAASAWAGIVMATFWGLVRAVFLVRARSATAP